MRAAPGDEHIGRIMRIDCRFRKLANGQEDRCRGDKTHPCVVVASKGDYFIVAPVSHSRSKSGAGDIQLTASPRRSPELRQAGAKTGGETGRKIGPESRRTRTPTPVGERSSS